MSFEVSRAAVATETFADRPPSGVIASAIAALGADHDLSTGVEPRRITVDTVRASLELFVPASQNRARLIAYDHDRHQDGSFRPVRIALDLELDVDVTAQLFAETDADGTEERNASSNHIGPLAVADPISALAGALISVDEISIRELYAKSLGLMIAARLLSGARAAETGRRGRAVSALPKWRLRRVLDHVEANLSETITLADMARTAGLTPMYFAAQFRVAKRMRPHDYVLSRRVECAQERLLSTSDRLVDIALDVGFQTQAHFTTVFKRFAGTTPHRWRERAREIRAAA